MSLFKILPLFLLCLAMAVPVPARAQSGFDDPGARSGGKGGGGGDLVAVTAQVSAGAVTLGSAAQVVLLFRNEDSKPLSSGAISLYPSSNVSGSVVQNQCAAEPLPPGAVCAVAFSVKGLQVGNFRIEMLMRHEGKSRLLTATISGTVETSGTASGSMVSDIEATPNEVEFGSLNASRPQVSSVVLRNVTSLPLEITSVDIESNPGAGFSLKTDCSKLESGAACLATVTWAPENIGPASGVIVINHTGATGVASVPLSGEYAPGNAVAAEVFPQAVPGKGLLVASQTEVDFGSGITTTSAMTVSLVNVGDAPLTLGEIRMSNSDNGVRVLTDGCRTGTTLAPIEACPLSLTWDPVREGAILDDLQILHNGARGILVLPLRGSAGSAVNKDSKALMVNSVDGMLRGIPPISSRDLEEGGVASGDEPLTSRGMEVNVSGVLDGYSITSHAPRRAIITGPGGSRVIFDGEETVIGGVLWQIGIRPSAVQFAHGEQKVLLLFDRSLSSPSVNSNNRQSGGGGSSSSSSSASSSDSSSSD